MCATNVPNILHTLRKCECNFILLLLSKRLSKTFRMYSSIWFSCVCMVWVCMVRVGQGNFSQIIHKLPFCWLRSIVRRSIKNKFTSNTEMDKLKMDRWPNNIITIFTLSLSTLYSLLHSFLVCQLIYIFNVWCGPNKMPFVCTTFSFSSSFQLKFFIYSR